MRADSWEFRSIAMTQSYTCNQAAWFMEMTQLILLKNFNMVSSIINQHLNPHY